MSNEKYLSLNEIVKNFEECTKDYSTVRLQLIELLAAVGVDMELYKMGEDDQYYFTNEQAEVIEELMVMFAKTLKIRQGSYEGVSLQVSSRFDYCVKVLIETLNDKELQKQVEKRLATMEMYYLNYHLNDDLIKSLQQLELVIEHPEVLRLFREATQKFYDEYRALQQALKKYSAQLKSYNESQFNLKYSAYDSGMIGFMTIPTPPVFMDIYNELQRKC